ncbi:unnamed protein product [Bursaphelenchus xylophilus]|uniref:(pine wood nematode) hypothetical protein n=1 Tax=Bursaphelenchus xylophilus TaxID=6326 RepID=A0A811LSX8_BURXY|nr:unnamed protein product [Bursaphelenchus xylophilus]CAG9121080.1 unnamed protein product [Bursaphelenchus xylophilus]
MCHDDTTLNCVNDVINGSIEVGVLSTVPRKKFTFKVFVMSDLDDGFSGFSVVRGQNFLTYSKVSVGVLCSNSNAMVRAYAQPALQCLYQRVP